MYADVCVVGIKQAVRIHGNVDITKQKNTFSPNSTMVKNLLLRIYFIVWLLLHHAIGGCHAATSSIRKHKLTFESLGAFVNRDVHKSGTTRHHKAHFGSSLRSRHHSYLLLQSKFGLRVAETETRHVRAHEVLLTMRGGDSSITAMATLGSHSSEASVELSYNASDVDAGTLTMDEIWGQLQTGVLGLTNEEATRRLQQYGPNALQKPPTKSLLALILNQFEDRLVQILLAVAILSALFSVAEVTTTVSEIGSTATQEALWKSFVEPLVIIAILALNAAVGVWQSRSASDSLDALEQLQAAMCAVIRNDPQQQQASQAIVTVATGLVPGDIIELRTGDKIPADGRLISLTSSVLTVDEGPLTGESVAVFKLPADEGRTSSSAASVSEQRGMLFAGTCVTQGSGRVVVTQTGMDTQFGRIQRGVLSAKAEQPKTPLQIKLDDFGETLTVIIGVICLAVWIVSIPKMNDPSFSSVWEGGVYYAKVAVALGVAAIPEGLPAVITLCLSLGTRRMAQRNVIVRNLPSVETLGCTSVICTDKTGTLTTNEVSPMKDIICLLNIERLTNSLLLLFC
jgi:magnesium-transporting ATPase (P-type)